MKTLLITVMMSLLVLSVVPGVFAVSVGTGVQPDISTEKFPPRVWMCDNRIVYDDATEPGRITADGQRLWERINNYAFEGEQISWRVLVMDKNGFEKIKDVYGTVGTTQGAGNNIEVNCQLDDLVTNANQIEESCNARIGQATLAQVFHEGTAAYYTCTLTVETAASMYGEYWITVEAEDLDGLMGTMDENEFWFFNPVVAITVDGSLSFSDIQPGTQGYSSTLTIGNDADAGSGVTLDMFISGTDFYDSSSSGAKCPTTNQLSLQQFRYFATNGAYSTSQDAENGVRGAGAADDRDRDAEGYVNIGYGLGFHDPTNFYNGFEILQGPQVGGYYVGNTLTPGAEMALTFKLALPEPCNGDFDTGSIYFWGEAI